MYPYLDHAQTACPEFRHLPVVASDKMKRAFAKSTVAAIDASQILGVRAGLKSDHRFVGIWPVVVGGRVFGRSWSLKPGGWYRTFLEDSRGTMRVGDREIKIRAVPARSERTAMRWK